MTASMLYDMSLGDKVIMNLGIKQEGSHSVWSDVGKSSTAEFRAVIVLCEIFLRQY